MASNVGCDEERSISIPLMRFLSLAHPTLFLDQYSLKIPCGGLMKIYGHQDYLNPGWFHNQKRPEHRVLNWQTSPPIH